MTFHPGSTGEAAILAGPDGTATYRVALRVTTTPGFESIADATVLVRNVAPSGTFSASGDTVAFTGPTDAPADLARLRFSYDFDGDGTFEITNVPSSSVTVPAGYLVPGTVTRACAAIDDGEDVWAVYVATITTPPASTPPPSTPSDPTPSPPEDPSTSPVGSDPEPAPDPNPTDPSAPQDPPSRRMQPSPNSPWSGVFPSRRQRQSSRRPRPSSSP